MPGSDQHPFPHPCLLGLSGLSPDDLRTLLFTARSLADVSQRSIKKVPSLRGKVVANLFFEDSTRTRLSFTLAAQRLSADVIDLTESGSSVSKGETIADTVSTVVAMGVDALIIRHKAAGASQVAARAAGPGVAVINAGDGKHEHPTQGLLDIYALVQHLVEHETNAARREKLEHFDLTGVTLAIVGDVVSSRVARSDIAGFTALGAKVIAVGPPTLAPRSLTALGCEVEHDLERVLPHVDAVNMLRIQFERHDAGGALAKGESSSKSSPSFPSLREYTHSYALTRERAAMLRPHAAVMHPGPMNRGIEIAGEVADGPRSVVLDQVTSGLCVRMAALLLCIQAAEAAERAAASLV